MLIFPEKLPNEAPQRGVAVAPWRQVCDVYTFAGLRPSPDRRALRVEHFAYACPRVYAAPSIIHARLLVDDHRECRDTLVHRRGIPPSASPRGRYADANR